MADQRKIIERETTKKMHVIIGLKSSENYLLLQILAILFLDIKTQNLKI